MEQTNKQPTNKQTGYRIFSMQIELSKFAPNSRKSQIFLYEKDVS